jgi:hypothetical protein
MGKQSSDYKRNQKRNVSFAEFLLDVGLNGQE